ncbi:Phenylacetic acid catabolic protein [Polyangium sp. 6x1]|uniref:Phenylacetic acid catabolic protein n=1 Tax=Polyangium sp. 6x1 TaxID=3042689 RepID=UPI0024830598|nr:Phenylacetic acid catabolic protein [Polyangium sp. 6x1]MDI1449501.1 phenylacetate-CoA oxygenase subunit PaaI [Polyangium sp. 6x1]
MTKAPESGVDDRRQRTLVQMMQGQAYRELAAAHIFGHGLEFVPEMRWLKHFTWHIREELEHYEAVARMYHDFTGESIEPVVNARLAARPVPLPASFYELAMAQFLYDRGGFWQLREYEECSFEPYRKVVRKIVEEERGHQSLGERLVVELTLTGRYNADKQKLFERWLRQGLLSFGRPGSEGARYALAVGLKKRDPGAVMQDFLDDIASAMYLCGLTMPPLATLGIEGPEKAPAPPVSGPESALPRTERSAGQPAA